MPTVKNMLILAALAGVGWYFIQGQKVEQAAPVDDAWEMPNIEFFDFLDEPDGFWEGFDSTGGWISETYEEATDWLSDVWDKVTE